MEQKKKCSSQRNTISGFQDCSQSSIINNVNDGRARGKTAEEGLESQILWDFVGWKVTGIFQQRD